MHLAFPSGFKARQEEASFGDQAAGTRDSWGQQGGSSWEENGILCQSVSYRLTISYEYLYYVIYDYVILCDIYIYI